MSEIIQMGQKVDFTFDPVQHAYLLGSRSVPSVTTVLAGTGLIPDFLNTKIRVVKQNIKRKADHGLKVHRATEMIDTDDLDWSTLDPKRETPYVMAYERFKDDYGFAALLAEHPLVVFTQVGPYGMTLDRYGHIAKKSHQGYWILDIKCTAKKSETWRYQTAPYWYGYQKVEVEHARATAGSAAIRRGVLWLRDNGNYQLIEHPEHEHDMEIFFAALMVYHERLRHEGIGFDDLMAKYVKSTTHEQSKGV